MATTSTRVRVACNACKQKKLKCDRNIPACSNCAKADRTCIIEDPSTKRQLPPGYTAVLEERVAHLEALLRTACPEIAIDHLSPSLSVTQPITSSPSRHLVQNEYTHMREGNSVENERVVQDVETLCVSSAIGQPRYLGPSSSLALSKVLSATLGRLRFQGPGLTMGSMDNEFLRDLPRSEPAPLPDKLFGAFLSDAFFTHVHPQYPFLHQPTFTQWENEVYFAIDSSLSPDPTQLFFVNMVYAVGAAIRPAQSPIPAASLYAAAELLFEQAMTNTGFQFIQALLLCAMYSMRSSVGVSVWMLSGLAMRHCIELALHRNVTWSIIQPNESPLDLEMKRRVFWVSYNIDRASAMTLGRPISLNDEDISVPLPMDINDNEISVNGLTCEPRSSDDEQARMMSPSLHFIQLRRIWANIQFLDKTEVTSASHQQNAEHIDQQLLEWFRTAPPPPPDNSILFSGRDWLALSYHHSILLLHRRRIVVGSAYPQIEQSYLKCAQSSVRICEIYRDIYFTNTVSFTWGALHVLFIAGLTFLHALWTSRETRLTCRRDVVRTCTNATMVLVVMAERWNVAQPYRDIFNLLADATQAMLADPDGQDQQLPALRRSDNIAIPALLNSISEVGIDRSAELLLHDMVE